MTNLSSFPKNFLYLPFALALAASGCDNSSSANESGVNVLVTPSEMSNSSDNGTTDVNNQESTDAQQYEDAFVRLSYPEDWILNTMAEAADAQFLEPGLNAQGGQSNCGLISEPVPGASLVEFTAEFLDIYNDFPEPQTSFIIVNGTDMARINGTITALGVTIDAPSQLAYKNGIAHAVLCVAVDPENVELIFNSMVIK